MASVGRNIVFPIKNADGSSFHNLVMHKATVDSVVMSLGDKITGDVYYKDNTLQCTMQEYVEYNGVKYTIVNPPTIVREGLVKDNSDLKGMTKYSFEFYHPMYILGNLPFSDVAVSNDEERYLSQNKTFSWIGKPQDYINKINKNLEGTEWIVVKSDRFPQGKDDELSDVLSFDNATIADALKTGYETWGLPYVVSQINQGEEYYSQGKRFKVEFGLPSNEILVDNEPYTFHFGQGVGLKNNSRTPRNNKIITRIAGYGSENNIPYGYPQIRWYGDQSATQTPDGYPIYDGIVGGAVRKLIKHPFTRTHLMPSIYTQTVFNKVSPYLANGSDNPDYDPDTEIIDYYDAVYSEQYKYINEINLLAPSYEIHEFADIKPELDSDRQLGIVSAIPLNQDLTPASKWDDTYDAEKDEYIQSYFRITLPQLSFDIYACASITEEMQINMRSGACLGCTFPIQVDWEDYKKNFYDADGNFLPDGSQRDLTKYPKSNLGQIDIIVQKETQTFGTLMPNIYQKPMANDLFVILGISLPLEYITNAEERLDDVMKSYMLENNVYYYDYPLKFDEHFLATNPNILSQIRPNSIIRFGFKGYPTPLELFVKQLTVKYGEGVLPQYDITLTDNIEVVLNQIGQVANDVEKLGSLVAILRQTYNRNIWSELDKKLSKVKDDSTPHKLGMGEMQVDGDGAIGNDLSVGGDLSVDGDTELNGDVKIGTSASNKAIVNAVMQVLSQMKSQNYVDDNPLGKGGWNLLSADANGNSYFVIDKLFVRLKAIFNELEIRKISYAGGNIIFSHAGSEIVGVKPLYRNGSIYAYRCYCKKDDGTTATENWWKVDDQAKCQTFNIETGVHQNVENTYYWRKVVAVGSERASLDGTTSEELYNYVDLSLGDCDANSDIPKAGDSIIQMGNRTDTGRQGFISLEVFGSDAPAIKVYKGVNSYNLDDKMPIIISPKNTSMKVQHYEIETDYGVFPAVKERGEWDLIDDHKCYYFDRVQHNGSSWLCTYPQGSTPAYTTEEPSVNATYWKVDAQAGESAPSYTEEWYAWSNVQSVVNATTEPTPNGGWNQVIGGQGTYAYLWKKLTRYTWNSATRVYVAGTAQYFRMSGTNGTSIKVKGSVATVQDLPSTHTDGDAYVVDADRHLYMWSAEGNQWLDIGEFKGENGKTFYTHVAWATSVTTNPSTGEVTNVTGFTIAKTADDTTHLWMGVYVDENSAADPDDALLYTWSYTKGVQGTSVSVDDANSKTQYAVSTSSTVTPSSWQDTMPTVPQGQFLWTKVTTAFTDGKSTVSYGVSYRGTDGNDVQIDTSRTYVRYSTVKTASQPADSTFTRTTPPSLSEGDYLWSLSQTAYVGVTNILKSYSVSRLGIDGAEGQRGPDGYTTHFAYATSADGSQDFSTTNFAGATFIGTYKDDKSADSTDYTKYVWTAWRGASIIKSSETSTYKVSDSGTATPTGTWYNTKAAADAAYAWSVNRYMWTKTVITWSDNSTTTLYSAERNPDDGVDGMSIVIDSQSVTYSKQTSGNLDPTTLTYGAYPSSLSKGDWLYSKTTVAYKKSDGTSAGTTNSYSVSYIGTDGTNGRAITGITEHYKASANATGETTPTSTDWGTTPTPSDWGESKPYLWNYEKITYSSGTTVQRTTAGVVAMWTKDGAGIDSITNYYLATSASSGVTPSTSGWTTTVQAMTETNCYLWNYEKTTYTQGKAATTTTPHIIGHYGRDGEVVTKVNETYRYATNNTGTRPDASSSSWQTTKPTLQKGYWLYTETTIHWSNNTETVLYTSERNPNDGVAGQSIIVDGSTVMKYYVGSSSTTHPDENSSEWKDLDQVVQTQGMWLWSKSTTYYRKANSTSGSHDAGSSVQYNVSYIAEDGDTPEAARGVESVTEYYKATNSSSPMSKPTSDSGWDTDPNLSNLTNKWSETYKYLWNYEKVTYNKAPLVERTIPQILAIWTKDGNAGKGIDSITNYYLINNSSTAPSRPSTDGTGGWSTTPTPPNSSNPYLWNYEKIVWLNPSSTTYTDVQMIGHYGKDGTSSYVADIDNEMDAVQTDDKGYSVKAQSVTTTAKLYYGNTARTFKTAVSGYTSGTAKNGVTVTWNNRTTAASSDTITFAFATTAKFTTGKMDFAITLTDGTDTSVTRTVHFTVNGINGDVYNIVPSVSEIVATRDASGNYLVNGSSTYTMGCKYTKDMDGARSTYDVADDGSVDGKYYVFRALRRRSDQKWQAYNNGIVYDDTKPRFYFRFTGTGPNININTFDAMEILLCANGSSQTTGWALSDETDMNILDRELVYVVANGTDGLDGISSVFESSHSTQWALSNSATTQPTSWSNTRGVPTQSQRFLWQKDVYEYTAQEYGRNLMRGTEDLDKKGNSSTSWSLGGVYLSGSGGTVTRDTSQSLPIVGVKSSIKIVNTNASQIGFAQGELTLHTGKIIMSCWVKGASGNKIMLQPAWNSATSQGTAIKTWTLADSNWTRIWCVGEITTEASTWRIGYVYSKTNGSTIYVTGLKVEYGDTMTDWNKAPEDYNHTDIRVVEIAGEDGVSVYLESHVTLFTQDINNTSTITPLPSKTNIIVKKGGTTVPFTDYTVSKPSSGLDDTHCTYSVTNTSGEKSVTISAIGTYAEGGKNYYYENGFARVNVTYEGSTYVLDYKFLLNAIGKFKTIIEGDVETSIASKKFYEYNPATGQYDKETTMGEFIRSSSLNESTLSERVDDKVVAMSEVLQRIDGISLKVYDEASIKDLFTHDADIVLQATTSATGVIPTTASTSDCYSYSVAIPIIMRADTSSAISFRVRTKQTTSGSVIVSHLTSISIANGVVTNATDNGRLDVVEYLKQGNKQFLKGVLSFEYTTSSAFKVVVVEARYTGTNPEATFLKTRTFNVGGVSLKKGLQATGIDIEKGKIINRANQWEVWNLSDQRTAWIDDMGNFTIRGVYNNLITVIDENNWDKYIIKMGSGSSAKFYLDVLKCGTFVMINYLPVSDFNAASDGMLHLPYYANDNYFTRGYTRYLDKSDATPRLMTADELRMLAGRKMVIKWNAITGISNNRSLGYVFRPKVYYGSSTITTSLLDSRLRDLYAGEKHCISITTSDTTVNRSPSLYVPKTFFMSFEMVKFHASQSASDYSWGYIWMADDDAGSAVQDDIEWD